MDLKEQIKTVISETCTHWLISDDAELKKVSKKLSKEFERIIDNEIDSNVENLFIELENIFDNYTGYNRRLKAYEAINAALHPSRKVNKITSVLHKRDTIYKLREVAEYVDCALELGSDVADFEEVSDIIELMRDIVEDNHMFIRN
jgi:membrane-associated HD superfamily phosphohydrolase